MVAEAVAACIGRRHGIDLNERARLTAHLAEDTDVFGWHLNAAVTDDEVYAPDAGLSVGADRKADLAVWRPSDATWYIKPSTGGSFYGIRFGQTGDQLVPGAYYTTGATVLAVTRANGSAANWYLRDAAGQVDISTFGLAGDIPVPAGYLPG